MLEIRMIVATSFGILFSAKINPQIPMNENSDDPMWLA